MIKVIVGKKGSGKTKLLLDAVNQGIMNSDGNLIYIDNSDQHSFQLDHRVRLINALNYDINDHERFYGFITGILAGNYDITDVYVDAILRIVGRDYDELSDLLNKLEKVTNDVTVIFTISADLEELPESIKKYI